MNDTKFNFRGKVYSFVYNGNAFFSIREMLGDTNIVSAISPETQGSFQTCCNIAAILAEQGELVRRYHGFDSRDFLDCNELMLFSSPQEALPLRQAIIAAVVAGLNREVKDSQTEVDLGLQELSKKKAGK